MKLNKRIVKYYVTREAADGETSWIGGPIWRVKLLKYGLEANVIVWSLVGLVAAAKLAVGW